eukprot:5124529-Amphidinium_carterae.1
MDSNPFVWKTRSQREVLAEQRMSASREQAQQKQEMRKETISVGMFYVHSGNACRAIFAPMVHKEEREEPLSWTSEFNDTLER